MSQPQPDKPNYFIAWAAVSLIAGFVLLSGVNPGRWPHQDEGLLLLAGGIVALACFLIFVLLAGATWLVQEHSRGRRRGE